MLFCDVLCRALDGAILILHGHPIPIYTHRERVSSTRSLLVGDAAGLTDPLSGEGIRFAIKSGRLAAESILSGHPEHYPHFFFYGLFTLPVFIGTELAAWIMHRLGQAHLSDRLRAFIYPEAVKESYRTGYPLTPTV